MNGSPLWHQNPALKKWILDAVLLCKPDHVHLCTGSEEEFQELVKLPPFIPLNPEKRPGSFYCRSDPGSFKTASPMVVMIFMLQTT